MSVPESPEHIFPDNLSRYSSAYTMYDADGTVRMYEDDLMFMCTEPREHCTNVTAMGMVDSSRVQMQLIMRSKVGSVAGRWMECDFDSGAVLQNNGTDLIGDVEFIAGKDGRYYGRWTSSSCDGNQIMDGGTWVLTPH